MASRSDEGMSSQDLLERVADIARQLSEADTLDDLLQRVVDVGESYLEGCDGVSLMLVGRRGSVSTPAYSSAVARDSDLAQYEANEGPCLSAMREQSTVIIDDLEADERWPQYRKLALKLGVRSMISFRLFVSVDTLGALDFYSSQAQAFDRYSQSIGQVFASHAGVALKAGITEAGLEDALRSRDVIGQAKGILMAAEGLTAEAAFARLTAISQRTNRPLREVAAELARTSKVPATPEAEGGAPPAEGSC